jgi:hypothetical protein
MNLAEKLTGRIEEADCSTRRRNGLHKKNQEHLPKSQGWVLTLSSVLRRTVQF